ncbi:NAD(P)/FAD-dependent oxidoreductase [Haloactinopolyspora sp.]|uniref:NAD(P)/FAD-dependent oxidoreductase n=1 Tax=Haloactinopolyspora sp. TaxID=1966353 RepID=UPI002625C472|nr:NAD(P)/FAD-dependent oxidoreductase [Haloactinopolyspora sp.]
MTDLVIAGGGPVGLAAALYAVRAGLSVVLYEPRAGTIDKACGEGLMPGAVAALAGLGVHPAGHRLRGIRYIAGDRRAHADFRAGPGLGVRRTTLHAALRCALDATAVQVVAEPVTKVTQDATGIVANDTRGRYLIAADGLHSRLRRQLGLEAPVPAVRRFGLRRHLQTAPWTDYVEVHWSRWAEAYVTPVGPDLVGVAILTTRRASFDEQVDAFDDLRERVRGCAVSSVRGAGPLRQRTRRRVAGRALLAGDASGYVDALTGEGIALGMAQAREAVAAVAAGRPQQYEQAWRRVTRRYDVLTRSLVAVTSVRPGRRALVPMAAALPRVFSAAVDQLARPA